MKAEQFNAWLEEKGKRELANEVAVLLDTDEDGEVEHVELRPVICNPSMRMKPEEFLKVLESSQNNADVLQAIKRARREHA